MTLTPRPYQIEGRDFLAGRTHALLADEMRVGKTGQAILAAEKIGAGAVLVLCPAIAVPVWRDAWREWGATGNLEAYSYDYAIRHPEVVRRPWDVFIADECHFARNPLAQRTDLVYGKDGAAWHAKRTWALSGTPVLRHAGEVWAMGRAFGYIGARYEDFVAAYCYVDRLTQRVLGTKMHKADELNALLAKFMLRRTRKQVAPDMPEIAFNYLPIQGKPPKGIDFAGTDEEYLAWMEGNATHDAELRIATALAKVEPLSREIAFAIENALLDRVVVFGHHAEPLQAMVMELIQKDLRVETITGATPATVRQKVQAAFRSGECQVLVANILAAGTAIDLSSASHAYFLELDWLPANNAQAASRLVNLEKRAPVTCDVATWPGSQDDRMVRLLTRRAQEISRLY